MRTLTIDEIQQLEHGEAIPSFTGRISKINKQISGEGQWGTWTLQNMVVTQGQLEIPVTWTGEDAFDDTWEGASVEFCCSENKQGKLVGITRDIRTDKKNVTHRGVKVTTAAKIKRILNGDAPQSMEQKQLEDEPVQSMEQKPSNGDKIEKYASHALRVFNTSWDKSLLWMGTLPPRDAAEMSLDRYYDLRMRVAQHIAIEVAKIIRKERF